MCADDRCTHLVHIHTFLIRFRFRRKKVFGSRNELRSESVSCFGYLGFVSFFFFVSLSLYINRERDHLYHPPAINCRPRGPANNQFKISSLFFERNSHHIDTIMFNNQLGKVDNLALEQLRSGTPADSPLVSSPFLFSQAFVYFDKRARKA